MKKIFEEYGGVIHVALAIVALICVVALLVGGPNGGWIGGAFQDITGKFLDKTTGAINGGASVAPVVNIVNVKDYGAVGDGATDDHDAIMSAFDYAIDEFVVDGEAVTVYFPEGEYALMSNLTVQLPAGSGDLTIKGDGADKSTIVALDGCSLDGRGGVLVVRSASTPTTEDEYLHDITIKDLGVRADATIGTNGISVRYCNNFTITKCDASDNLAAGIYVVNCSDGSVSQNTVSNTNEWGIKISAETSAPITDVIVKDNNITNCTLGGVCLAESGQKDNVTLIDNTIKNTATGIGLEGANANNTLIDGCTIDTVSDCGIRVSTSAHIDTVIKNTTIKNAQTIAISNAGTNTQIDHVTIDGVGLAGGVTDGAILQNKTSGSSAVSNTTILNCQNKKGIMLVQSVTNTTIEQVETSGYISIQSADMIKDCKVNRYVQAKNGCTIDGLELTTAADLGTHAIALSNLTNCTITNCTFTMPSSSYAVYESGEADYNTVTNNTANGSRGFKVIGENSVSEGNVQN